ncbi:MAG: multiheme c-type cytochrome, partial [Actinomycetota bacterium]|nr:multiheme c-type cytochrome [Actinomycetota bacterium]
MKNRFILMALTAAALLALAAPAFALPQVPVDKFQPSQACGCHSALLEEWSRSMHAKAMTDPIYRLKVNEANKATDGAIGPFCDGCHGPVATMGGQAKDLSKAAVQAQEGINCDFCHQVSGTGTPIGNVSQILTPTGVKRAQFDDARSPAHETAYSAFHETAEFCGTCHNVDHPGNGMHLEATYTEWKEGPYAAEDTTCQDCHMTPGPGETVPNAGTAAAGGPQRQHIFTMTFAGGNVALGDADLAEERLKAAATMEVQVPEIVEVGSSADVVVTITNSGAGHKLPTGLTEVRQMWLEVTAEQED